MQIERKYGDFRDLAFQLDLTAIGKTDTDIDDIYFSIKSDLTQDDDAIFFKTRSGGGITYSSGNILVKWASNEYDNITVGKNYKAGVFVKFVGDSNADENVDQTFELIVKQDFLRA